MGALLNPTFWLTNSNDRIFHVIMQIEWEKVIVNVNGLNLRGCEWQRKARLYL